MHHNILVSPLGLFQFNIVCVRSGTFPLTTSCFFHLHFQLPDLHEETCFQVKIRQAILGYTNQRKVGASLWLFLKSGKIPGLLCIGNRPEHRPFRDLRCVPEAGTLRPYERGTATRPQYLLRCGAWKWGSPTALGLRFSMQFLCVVDDDFFFLSISTVQVIIQKRFQCNIYLLHDPTC
jgi:hypothetical protein